MIKLKLLVIAFLGLLFCANSFAQNANDGEMLYVYTKTSQDAAQYDLSELKKVTFSSKGVQLWNTAWPTEYPYNNVSVISFKRRSSDPSSVTNINSDRDEKVIIGYNVSSNTVTVVSNSPLNRVAVYNLQGQLVTVDDNHQQVYNVPLYDIPQGVYVVKAYGQRTETIKKIVKQ